MSESLIRQAKPDDMNALAEIMYEYIVDFYKRPKPRTEKVQNLIKLLLEHHEGIQFVAQHDGKLIGFATIYFSYSTLRAEKVAIMNDLYVVESERGRGVAIELFEACHRFSKEHECAYMSWVTASDNKRAQRFYEKMGGTVGDWMNYSI